MVSISCSHEERWWEQAIFSARTPRAAAKSEKFLVLRNCRCDRARVITVGDWDPGGVTIGRVGLRFERPRNGKDFGVFAFPGFVHTGFLLGAENLRTRFPADSIGISDRHLQVRQRHSGGVLFVSLSRGAAGVSDLEILQV